MKVKFIRGSNIGTHPCAGEGWRVTPETEAEQRKLKALVEELNPRFPLAITAQHWEARGGAVFVPYCCVQNRGNVPQCDGPPPGALEVARAILSLLGGSK